MPPQTRPVVLLALALAAAAPLPASAQQHPMSHGGTAITGPVVSGQPAPGVATVAWAAELENLTYSNPFGQQIGPVWYNGRRGWAIHAGELWIDPPRTKWANQYLPVYSATGGANGGPEMVAGQNIIYDSAPGDPNYSPIWRHNWVIVPRGYQANALRSLDQIRRSGYRIITTDLYFN